MDIAEILVVISGQEEFENKLTTAFNVARQFDASVIGLFVCVFPTVPSYIETRLPDDLKRRRFAGATKLAAACETAFRRQADEQNIRHDWTQAIGRTAEVLPIVLSHARHTDLTVLTRSDGEPKAGVLSASLAEEVVIASGSPVLLLPEGGGFDVLGKRIVIGWNGSREATRALHDAIPFLKAADDVMLLTVDGEDDAPETTLPNLDISHHLSRHGIDASVRQSLVSGTQTGDVILSRGDETGADMIVIGAYGHSRIMEFALGGVTRHVMSKATVPVLMSH